MVPPQASGVSPRSASSFLTRSGLAFGLSILLIATRIGHARRFRVIDRLARLRHDAVVGRHHEDDDVGDARAARAHHGERFVARRVEEHDVAIVHPHRVGADVLRDAARFALGDTRGANRVEQRRLAVVDVAHDGHDRRARNEIGRIDVLGLDLQHLLFEGLHLHVGAEFPRDHRGGLVVERAVDRHHQAAVHQLLEDVLRLDVELRRKIGDGHAFCKRDRARDRGRRRLHRCGRLHSWTDVSPRAGTLAARPMMHGRTVRGHAGTRRRSRAHRLRRQWPRATHGRTRTRRESPAWTRTGGTRRRAWSSRTRGGRPAQVSCRRLGRRGRHVQGRAHEHRPSRRGRRRLPGSGIFDAQAQCRWHDAAGRGRHRRTWEGRRSGARSRGGRRRRLRRCCATTRRGDGRLLWNLRRDGRRSLGGGFGYRVLRHQLGFRFEHRRRRRRWHQHGFGGARRGRERFRRRLRGLDQARRRQRGGSRLGRLRRPACRFFPLHRCRRVGKRRVRRDVESTLPRHARHELARDDLFDCARCALHLDAVVALEQRHHFLARGVQKLRDFVDPDCCHSVEF